MQILSNCHFPWLSSPLYGPLLSPYLGFTIHRDGFPLDKLQNLNKIHPITIHMDGKRSNYGRY